MTNWSKETLQCKSIKIKIILNCSSVKFQPAGLHQPTASPCGWYHTGAAQPPAHAATGTSAGLDCGTLKAYVYFSGFSSCLYKSWRYASNLRPKTVFMLGSLMLLAIFNFMQKLIQISNIGNLEEDIEGDTFYIPFGKMLGIHVIPINMYDINSWHKNATSSFKYEQLHILVNQLWHESKLLHHPNFGSSSHPPPPAPGPPPHQLAPDCVLYTY